VFVKEQKEGGRCVCVFVCEGTEGGREGGREGGKERREGINICGRGRKGGRGESAVKKQRPQQPATTTTSKPQLTINVHTVALIPSSCPLFLLLLLLARH
jgi:hypothetical protein